MLHRLRKWLGLQVWQLQLWPRLIQLSTEHKLQALVHIC